jgi:hypothetical protein
MSTATSSRTASAYLGTITANSNTNMNAGFISSTPLTIAPNGISANTSSVTENNVKIFRPTSISSPVVASGSNNSSSTPIAYYTSSRNISTGDDYAFKSAQSLSHAVNENVLSPVPAMELMDLARSDSIMVGSSIGPSSGTAKTSLVLGDRATVRGVSASTATLAGGVSTMKDNTFRPVGLSSVNAANKPRTGRSASPAPLITTSKPLGVIPTSSSVGNGAAANTRAASPKLFSDQRGVSLKGVGIKSSSPYITTSNTFGRG